MGAGYFIFRSEKVVLRLTRKTRGDGDEDETLLLTRANEKDNFLHFDLAGFLAWRDILNDDGE